MKNFIRKYPLFSLCGLNCGLCTMHIGKNCPGCGGGDGNQSCAIARCGTAHGVEFCCYCDEYPCEKYANMSEYDSFISHRNQLSDLNKLKCIGWNSYKTELDKRIAILQALLERYNDGRRKTLFSMAANLLALDSLQQVMAALTKEVKADMPIKEQATLAAAKLQAAAEKQGVSLKLRKKP